MQGNVASDAGWPNNDQRGVTQPSAESSVGRGADGAPQNCLRRVCVLQTRANVEKNPLAVLATQDAALLGSTAHRH